MTQALPSALEILRTRSLASLAAQEIERLILGGEIKAGERLNELALATRLGVSRGPVREAIRALEGSGLVVTVVNQGSFVRRVSAEEAHELYAIRILLTGQACADLAQHAGAAELAALDRLVQAMTAAEAALDAARYYTLNLEFHSTLLRSAGNKRAHRIYEELGNELNLFRRRSLVSAEGMRASNAEHAGIVAAIAAGDVEGARAAGEAHIAHGQRRFVATSPPAEVTQEDRHDGTAKVPRRRKAES